MWNWMHKNIHGIDAHIPKEFYCELREQPEGITKMVVDAVTQYNKTLPLAGHFERRDVKERLIKEAEEEAAKVFLEGILDIVQRGNS
jgi:hypothetical protein